MDRVELNLLTLKNEINHHESAHSDQIEKSTTNKQHEILNQMKVFKDALNRLSDVVIEEFEMVRGEYKGEV